MSKSKSRQALTNEHLTKNFSDNFTLALETMESARNFIHSGKDFTLSSLLDHMAKASLQEREVLLDEANPTSENSGEALQEEKKNP